MKSVLMSAIAALLAQSRPERIKKASRDMFDTPIPQHTATPDRKAWRQLKREKGFRQARLQRKAERAAAKINDEIGQRS